MEKERSFRCRSWLYRRRGNTLFLLGCLSRLHHCQPCSGALSGSHPNHQKLLSSLKPGGDIYMAVPERTSCFDKGRDLTSWPFHCRSQIWPWPQQEKAFWWVRHFSEAEVGASWDSERNIQERVRHLLSINYSIHFHTFESSNLTALINHCINNLNLPLKLNLLIERNGEIISINQQTRRYLQLQMPASPQRPSPGENH